MNVYVEAGKQYCDVFDWSPSLLGNRSRIHGYAHHSGIVALHGNQQ
jgi:hypothetical protein